MRVLCNKEQCTGCGACENSCPFDAISMAEDINGFRYPKINTELCIKCRKCERVCPEISRIKKTFPKKVYACYASDETIHCQSTSGGFATVLADYILSLGGIVYGHGFNSSMQLTCLRVDDWSELYRIQGTKYVQSSMEKIYESIASDIKKDRKVLFIGTPCQVAGVLNFFGNKVSNLITASFVCGGVPSSKFLHDYISDAAFPTFDDIKFRNNEIYGFRGFDNGNIKTDVHRWKSEYFIAFDEHISQRDSCFLCQYAQPERIGDFTIGDFWGLKNSRFPEKDIKRGVSLVIPTSTAAENLMTCLSKTGHLIIEEHTYDSAMLENPRLKSPVEKKKEVDLFRKLYEKVGFNASVRKIYGKKYFIYRVKSFFKRNAVLDRLYHKVIKHV